MVTDIIRMFAKYGFTETPLTIAEIEQCIKWGFDEDLIYNLGCDLANGFQWNEIIDIYHRHLEELDAFA